MKKSLAICCVLLCVLSPANAGSAVVTISAFTAPSLQFSSTGPLGTVTISPSNPSTITWSVGSGNKANTWTLSVQAPSVSLVNCTQIPISAITIQCISANSGGLTRSCNATSATALSTSPITIASGTQNSSSDAYSVSVQFALTDKWNYPANTSCSLNLTYTAQFN